MCVLLGVDCSSGGCTKSSFLRVANPLGIFKDQGMQARTRVSLDTFKCVCSFGFVLLNYKLCVCVFFSGVFCKDCVV